MTGETEGTGQAAAWPGPEFFFAGFSTEIKIPFCKTVYR